MEKFNLKVDSVIFSTTASLKKLEEPYDLIIIDECHKEPDRIYKFLKIQAELNPMAELLCLTGTPKRSYKENDLYEFAPISYRKTIDDSIKEGLLNNYEITVLLCPLNSVNRDFSSLSKTKQFLTTEKEAYSFWINRYNQSSARGFSFELQMLKMIFRLIKSKDRFINKLINKYKNEKTLIFLPSIDKTMEFDIPTYHSKLSKQEKSANLHSFIESDILHLTNVEGLVESINVPGLKNLIITRIDASDTKFLQLLGRALRLNPQEVANVIILVAENTIEVKWLRTALKAFDITKIKAAKVEDYDFTTN